MAIKADMRALDPEGEVRRHNQIERRRASVRRYNKKHYAKNKEAIKARSRQHYNDHHQPLNKIIT